MISLFVRPEKTKGKESFSNLYWSSRISRLWEVRNPIGDIAKHSGSSHQKELDQLLQSSWSSTAAGRMMDTHTPTHTHMATLHFASGNRLERKWFLTSWAFWLKSTEIKTRTKQRPPVFCLKDRNDRLLKAWILVISTCRGEPKVN